MANQQKLNALDRVKAKAKYNYERRLREAEEKQRFEETVSGTSSQQDKKSGK